MITDKEKKDIRLIAQNYNAPGIVNIASRRKMKPVLLVFRKPNTTSNSIEFLFHTIHDQLRQDFPVKAVQLPLPGKGLVNRIRNLLFLSRFRGRIVHITGDCYYAILGSVFS